MLVYDPAQRKTAKELLKTNYVKVAKLTAPDLEVFPQDENEDESIK